MCKFDELSAAVQKGDKTVVAELCAAMLKNNISPKEILDSGLLAGMEVIGEKFKSNEVFVPEVLMAAQAMNAGLEILKPSLTDKDAEPIGKAILGTVKGDLHDIGKNLVKIMMEGRGIEVIDLGTNVAQEQFIDAAIKENAQIIGCSALLTTTMPVMKEVVKKATEKGIRDDVIIMIGGAPVTQEFCDSIGADYYTPDAASAAAEAVELLTAKNSY